MDLPATLCFFVLFSSLLCYWILRRRLARARLPPGPTCLPLVGTLFSTDMKDVVGSLAKLAKQYGKIVTTQLGPYTTITLSDPALIKEAFSKDVFVSRPAFWSMEQRSKLYNNTKGIIFADGESWKEHRRFILQTFRDFGVGKLGMEDKVVEEARHLIQTLRESRSEAIDNKVLLSTTTANTIASVLSGTRYDHSDPAFVQYLAHVTENFRPSAGRTILDIMPWTQYLPGLREAKESFCATQLGIRSFLGKVCEDHLQNWVPGQNRDLLDIYISAIRSGQYKTFSTAEVPLILEDLFEAGYETTTTTLRWGFLMMCLHPAIQERVQKELDDIVGSQVIPKASDKYNLPYLEATIQEIHRYGSIVPLGVMHCAAEETLLASYTIPRGAWIMSNLRFIHHNEEWWDHPQTFDPSRFLGPEGDVRSSEYLMPFSVGKRRCVGEALAKAEIYTMFAAVLQNFTLVLPEGVSIDSVDPKPVPGSTADTPPHMIRYIPRRAS